MACYNHPLTINLTLSLYLGQKEYFYYFELLLKITKGFTDLTLLVPNLVKKVRSQKFPKKYQFILWRKFLCQAIGT